MSGLRPKWRPEASAAEKRLLDVRAEQLAKVPDEEDAGAQLWVAEFPVGDARYALPLEQVLAAMPLRRVTPVPLARPEIVGVLRHDGAVVSVYSLASLLGARGWRRDPEVLLVINLSDGRRVAFDCEETPRPSTVPASLFDGANAEGAVRDVILPDGGVLHLLDPARLLEQLEGRPHGR